MTSIPLSDSLQIQSQLHTLFRQRDEIPLFYVESGSRLWDFASPDSDFDVRGFHLQSREKYFDFGKHRDIIEVMDGNFDLVSYDIDKMFGLLAKCNPTVFEWVRAHICYMNVLPDWEQLQQDIASNYDFGALHYHYISMAKGQLNDMQNGNRFTYKKVFYCIRGLLSSDLATREIIPPLRIEELLDLADQHNPIIDVARSSINHKRSGSECLQVDANKQQIILTTIQSYMDELLSRKLQRRHDNTPLVESLTQYCIRLKSHYYGI